MGRERKEAHEEATPSSASLHLLGALRSMFTKGRSISVASGPGHDDSHPGWTGLCLQVMLGAFASCCRWCLVSAGDAQCGSAVFGGVCTRGCALQKLVHLW